VTALNGCASHPSRIRSQSPEPMRYRATLTFR
jgi:hypothetical protein